MTLAFQVLDRVWHPESPANADAWGNAGDVVLLLDGAAPLGSSERVCPEENEAVWLVRRFVEQFTTETPSTDAGSLLERVERTRQTLAGEYTALCTRAGLTPAESPFACLCLARFSAEALELYNMGDGTTLVGLAGGRVERFGTSAVRELDRQGVELLVREIIAGPATHRERMQNVRPRIMANRSLRNQLSGYDVLALDAATTGRLEQRSFARAEVESVLMMTDGFYRLVDTYHEYTDASLFQAAVQRGLGSLLAELRAIEQSDPECIEYPRFKAEDDATALRVGFV